MRPHPFLTTILLFRPLLTPATLLVNYTAPAYPSLIGYTELEASVLGDAVPNSASRSAPAYIHPGPDPDGRPALHFHRDATHRRAEVRAKGEYAQGKRYWVGYEFRLSRVHEHLALFQWKLDDHGAHTNLGQDIPFNLQFTEHVPPRLSLGYTPPSTDHYGTIFILPAPFDTNKTHNIALAWDTLPGSNANRIQFWFDGECVFEKAGLDLWTGPSFPKVGIYRGEERDHDAPGWGGGEGEGNVFDLWVYRVQIGDGGLEEVSAASGLGSGNGTQTPAGSGQSSVVARGSGTEAKKTDVEEARTKVRSAKPRKTHPGGTQKSPHLIKERGEVEARTLLRSAKPARTHKPHSIKPKPAKTHPRGTQKSPHPLDTRDEDEGKGNHAPPPHHEATDPPFHSAKPARTHSAKPKPVKTHPGGTQKSPHPFKRRGEELVLPDNPVPSPHQTDNPAPPPHQTDRPTASPPSHHANHGKQGGGHPHAGT